MSVEIVWKHHHGFFRGRRDTQWTAEVAGLHVGSVFEDGVAFLGVARHDMGSPYLAAQALVRYVEAGGR